MDVRKITIKNQLPELERIMALIDDLAGKWKLPSKTVMEINLVVEELVTNIIFYAFDDKDEHQITIDFSLEKDELQILVRDGGKPFNLIELKDEDEFNKPLEERKIGGLGIHFIKSMMDKISYERKENQNIVSLTKKVLT